MARTSSLVWSLLGLCLSRPALAVEPTSIPRATAQQVHQTVDRAIGYLQTESAAWLKTRKCAACHHVRHVVGDRRQASRDGAWLVRWRADGRELFYPVSNRPTQPSAAGYRLLPAMPP